MIPRLAWEAWVHISSLMVEKDHELIHSFLRNLYFYFAINYYYPCLLACVPELFVGSRLRPTIVKYPLRRHVFIGGKRRAAGSLDEMCLPYIWYK